jgi:hypothetical protein
MDDEEQADEFQQEFDNEISDSEMHSMPEESRT